jgi:hypothetical protein
MSEPLRDYERKRSRATKHFDRLRESIQRFTDLEAERRVRGKFNAIGSQYVFEVPLGKIDPDWTLMLGDFVYNTRAALDYLITALIRSAGNQEHEKSQFPIYGILPNVGWQNMDQWWDNDPSGAIARYLKDTPAGTKAALKPLQPFYGIPAVNPDRHPLAHLQLLSNRDKHRRLNLLVRNASLDF